MRFNYYEEAPFSDDPKLRNSTINQCIDLFTKEEVLEKGNEWYCNKCK